MTQVNDEDRSKKKFCVECKAEISLHAKKCNKCGSYQGAKRYIPISHGTLALIISLIALVSAVANTWVQFSRSVSEYLISKNKPFEISVVEIQEGKASFILTNRTPNVIAVSELQCGLYFFIDSSFQRLLKWQSDNTKSYPNERRPDWQFTQGEVLGKFLVSYKLIPHILLEPRNRKLVSGSVEHISPPLQTGSKAEALDYVANYCIVKGTNEHGQGEASVTLIKDVSVMKMDLMHAIKTADFHPEREHVRADLIEMVKKRRKIKVN